MIKRDLLIAKSSDLGCLIRNVEWRIVRYIRLEQKLQIIHRELC